MKMISMLVTLSFVVLCSACGGGTEGNNTGLSTIEASNDTSDTLSVPVSAHTGVVQVSGNHELSDVAGDLQPSESDDDEKASLNNHGGSSLGITSNGATASDYAPL